MRFEDLTGNGELYGDPPSVIFISQNMAGFAVYGFPGGQQVTTSTPIAEAVAHFNPIYEEASEVIFTSEENNPEFDLGEIFGNVIPFPNKGGDDDDTA